MEELVRALNWDCGLKSPATLYSDPYILMKKPRERIS